MDQRDSAGVAAEDIGRLLTSVDIDPRQGAAYGVAAYGLWGLCPLYFKLVERVAPVEVLAYRALWSFVMLLVIAHFLGRWREVRGELRNGRSALLLAMSALLIAANWLTFIYSIDSGQLLETSVGCFIGPLVSVVLGVTFLRERLRPYQLASMVLALAGVLVLAGSLRHIPWIAVLMASTFAFYSLIRKTVKADGLVSLSVETLFMMPCALAYLCYLALTGETTGTQLTMFGLLVLSGPVSTVPLLFFGAATRRLRLTTLGILQYLTPTLQFVTAVVVFNESFAIPQLITFICIWTAIIIYTADSYRALRQHRFDLLATVGAGP